MKNHCSEAIEMKVTSRITNIKRILNHNYQSCSQVSLIKVTVHKECYELGMYRKKEKWRENRMS